MTRLSSKLRALTDKRPIIHRRMAVRRIVAAFTAVLLAPGAVPAQAQDCSDDVDGAVEVAAQ